MSYGKNTHRPLPMNVRKLEYLEKDTSERLRISGGNKNFYLRHSKLEKASAWGLLEIKYMMENIINKYCQ